MKSGGPPGHPYRRAEDASRLFLRQLTHQFTDRSQTFSVVMRLKVGHALLELWVANRRGLPCDVSCVPSLITSGRDETCSWSCPP